MKKKINKLFMVLLVFSIVPNVKASSCSVSASSRSVNVGSKVTIYVKGNDAIGKFNLNSSNTSVLSGATSTWVENGTSAVTFTAKKVGSSTISVSPQSGLSNSNGNEISLRCNSVTVTVKTKSSSNNKINNKPTTTVKKSSVNTLKSLSIDGASLNPKFDKGTTEYNVILPKNTEKIVIKAEKEDKKASVSGIGEKKVTEGMNKFEVVVTAENGYKKTYTLNVEVEEEPINVTVDNKTLSVVKKENGMPEIPNYYDKTTVKINDIDVPAYKGTITNFILVGLKDDEGKTNLYIYDEKNNSYSLYNELKFSQINIYIKEFSKNKIPENYKKYEETINEQKIKTYKLNKNSKYSLIYGLNVETGEENIYKYNSVENTIQIFEREEQKLLEEELEQFKLVILGLTGFSVLLVFIIIILLITKRKNKTEKLLEKKD